MRSIDGVIGLYPGYFTGERGASYYPFYRCQCGSLPSSGTSLQRVAILGRHCVVKEILNIKNFKMACLTLGGRANRGYTIGRFVPSRLTIESKVKGICPDDRSGTRLFRRYGSKFLGRTGALCAFHKSPAVMGIGSCFRRGRSTCFAVRCLSKYGVHTRVRGDNNHVPIRVTAVVLIAIKDTLVSIRGFGVLRQSVDPRGVFLASGNSCGLVSFNTTEFFADQTGGDLSILLGPKFTPPRRCSSGKGRNP